MNMIKTADLALNGNLGTIRRFEVGVPQEMAEGFGNPAPMPVPAHLDYPMWPIDPCLEMTGMDLRAVRRMRGE